MSSETGPVTEVDLLRWAESLAGCARTGMAFTENLYERERYEEILRIAADIKRHSGRGYDPGEQVTDWMGEVGERTAGYVTPKTAIGAVVGNDDGEILLIQRADSGVWLYPTGWADIGYSPAEVAVKEVEEETGIECEPERLLTVIDGFRAGFTRVPLYSLVFLCRATGGELDRHPLETLDAGWFSRDALPEPLAGIGGWVDQAFAGIDGDGAATTFDSVRDSVWPEPPPEGTT
ncbi:MAG: NUDIX hydrolase N-terminal domain-containing protein [Actinomycetota bacterium]